MKKSSIVKAALCGGLALTIVATMSVPRVSSATLNAEKGLAGISITLDKYCANDSTVANTTVTETTGAAVSGSSVTTDAVVDEMAEYDNLALSVAADYVNIRKKPNTDSKVIGKLYRGAAATVLSNDGEWVKIESGSCTGYISTEFLAIGLRAQELEDEFGTKVAKVNTTTLKVREKADATSECLTMIPMGESYRVINDKTDGWVKISIDGGDIKGYVSEDYVDVSVEFDEAISIREEKAAAKAAAEAAAAEEAARAAEAAAKAANNNSSNTSNSSSSSSSSAGSKSSSSSNTKKSSSSSDSKSNSKPSNSGTTYSSSGTGADVASYAMNFVGCEYVYGAAGPNKFDCSGLAMYVYGHFGVSLPHSSASQSTMGTKVSLSNAQPGDLVFYASGGRVNHVAIYIGGGQVVSASNEKYGVRVCSVNYRTVYCVRRMI